MLIEAVINGARTRAECPALPVTPAQQAAAAAESVAAGAGAIHMHVRGADERESLAAEDVALALQAIRAAIPGVPVGISTVARIEPDTAARLRAVAAHAETKHEQLPAGFICRPLRQEDIRSRVTAYNLAFPGENLSLDDHATLRSCPGFVDALDLVVVNRSDDVVAFCTLWLDDANGAGLVEPVGCHPEYRRRGLTQFVVLDGLRRLWALGAKQAVVRVHSENTAARLLYQSCGFSPVSNAFGHEKRIA